MLITAVIAFKTQDSSLPDSVSPEMSDWRWLAFLLILPFVFVLSGFLAWNVFLISRNQTTIEYLQGDLGSKRNASCITNWNELFGTNVPILWIMPLRFRRVTI